MAEGDILFPGKRISGNSDLLFGALHPFLLPGWTPAELISVQGESWQMIFEADGADYVVMEL